MATTKRNEIIIKGIRHIFKDKIGFYPCKRCSLKYLCSTSAVCRDIFGEDGYFEIWERKK